jgi:hypothetical protein
MYLGGSLIRIVMSKIQIIIISLLLVAGTSCHLLLKRCKIKSCHIRTIHIHRGVEFRGSPWYKNQNPKTGEGFPNIINDKPKD